MKIEVIYTKKTKYTKDILEAMARYVKTYPKDMEQYNHQEITDLLVIGFDETVMSEQELFLFIDKIDRNYVKNICLVNTFILRNKKMSEVVNRCHKNRLPLMREQFSIKLNRTCFKEMPQLAKDNARIYIEDMVNVINQYY